MDRVLSTYFLSSYYFCDNLRTNYHVSVLLFVYLDISLEPVLIIYFEFIVSNFEFDIWFSAYLS